MWTVIGELHGQNETNKNDVQDNEGSHSYMLLSQTDSTMVFYIRIIVIHIKLTVSY